MVSYYYQLYNYIDFNIFFFNLLSFISGAFVLTYNLKQIYHNNKLNDCGDIYILSSAFTLHSFLIILLYKINYNFSVYISLTSIVLLVYNLVSYHNITDSCYEYFKKNYYEIWIFYIGGLLFLAVNIFSNLLKTCVCLKIVSSDQQIQYQPVNQDNRTISINEADYMVNTLNTLNTMNTLNTYKSKKRNQSFQDSNNYNNYNNINIDDINNNNNNNNKDNNNILTINDSQSHYESI